MWRLESPRGEFALKLHANGTSFEREVHAYRDVLSLDLSFPAPRWVASDPGPPRATLVTWVPGGMFSDLGPFDPGPEAAIFEAAGAVLRRFHAILPMAPATEELLGRIRSRTLARVGALENRLPRHVVAWARELAIDPGWRDGLPAGLCHRDFSPRNWLLGDDGRVSLLDFEHSEYDVLVTDVMKLWDGPFRGRDDLRIAFHRGYGCRPDDIAPRVRLLAASHGLAIVDWSLMRGQADYLDHGLAFLERAAGNDGWMWE